MNDTQKLPPPGSTQAVISPTSITIARNISFKSGFSGSSAYRMDGEGEVSMKPKRLKQKERKLSDDFPVYRQMNRTKVRKKMIAYSQLDKSKKFLAFYTITFPERFYDEDAYDCLNIVLTRIRRTRPNFSYLWVAERQKNTTLHFHMITNDYLNIRVVNGMFAIAIRNRIKRDRMTGISFNYTKYNGVDVSRVWKVSKVTAYIAKYVTKTENDDIRTMWNCSKSISALFTSYITDFKPNEQSKKWLKHYKTIKINTGDPKRDITLDVYIYTKPPPSFIHKSLAAANEVIFTIT